MVRDAIWDILNEDSTLDSLIGTDRIYRVAVAQEREAPFVLIRVLSMDDSHAKDTTSYIDSYRVQITSVAGNTSDVLDISERVRTVLESYVEASSTVVSPTLYVPVMQVNMIDDSDGYDADHQEYHIIQEYQIKTRRYTNLKSISYTNDAQSVADGVAMTDMVVTVLPAVTLPSGDLTYSISAGALPTGVSLNTGSGLISGTPDGVGSYTWTVQLVGSNRAKGTVTVACSMTVT